ncbi:glutathione S-transferase U9-like [Magnolia sinica]|uniref:glutathione S-transferase U9-like n=1 Tax=Magnolia sinica TaxID=86752 RepID=UPI00265993C3|nr:glutathione S-transferase U9-like [Magnolia sinica]
MEEVKGVKVHGTFGSPFCMRVEMALKLKGIPYEYVEEDVIGNKSESLLHYNPVYKKVPVLLHDGRPISESLIILEYIEDSWKDTTLLPLDPYTRAKVRFWAHFYDHKLILVSAIIMKCEGEEQEKAMKELVENLKILEEGVEKDFSGGTPYLNGDRPGLLDIILGSSLCLHRAIEEAVGVHLIDPQRYPLLWSRMDALKDLPVLKEITPPHHKMVARVRHVREMALKG